MESIFESLENLNVSEKCFEDIVGLIKHFMGESAKEDPFKDVQFANNPPRPVKVHDVPLDTKVKDRPDAAAWHIKQILGKKCKGVNVNTKPAS